MPVSQECLEARGPRSLVCVRVSLDWLETRTKDSKHVCKFLGSLTRLGPAAVGGELWIACTGTGVSTGGRSHSTIFFVVWAEESDKCVQVLFKENAWICARPTTLHDLVSVIQTDRQTDRHAHGSEPVHIGGVHNGNASSTI